jgi:hypothetical protein
MATKNRRTVVTLVGLLLTLGIPVLPISEWENEFENVRHLVGYEIIWWALIALVLLYVRLVERRPLRSVGFCAPGIRGVLIAIPAGVAMLAGLAVIYYVLFPALHVNEGQQMNQLIVTPFWWRFISVIRAARLERKCYFADMRSSGCRNSPGAAALPRFFPAPYSAWRTSARGDGAICSSPASAASCLRCFICGVATCGST